jgi:hypothetical protein
MKIYQTIIGCIDHKNGNFLICDTIKFQGLFWIVSEWLNNPETGKRKPKRIVCMDNLQYQLAESGKPYNFVVTQQISIDVLYGPRPKKTSILCIDSPEIWYPIPELHKFH